MFLQKVKVSLELLQSRNIRDSSNCSIWANKSDCKGLLNLGFAIKTASILVIKKTGLCLLYYYRWKSNSFQWPVAQPDKTEKTELWFTLRTNSQKDASVFLFTPLSPPFPHPHHHHQPLLNRQAALGVTAGITCQASGALPLANGLNLLRGVTQFHLR